MLLGAQQLFCRNPILNWFENGKPSLGTSRARVAGKSRLNRPIHNYSYLPLGPSRRRHRDMLLIMGTVPVLTYPGASIELSRPALSDRRNPLGSQSQTFASLGQATMSSDHQDSSAQGGLRSARRTTDPLSPYPDPRHPQESSGPGEQKEAVKVRRGEETSLPVLVMVLRGVLGPRKPC